MFAERYAQLLELEITEEQQVLCVAKIICY
jgi:hypothetical protein